MIIFLILDHLGLSQFQFLYNYYIINILIHSHCRNCFKQKGLKIKPPLTPYNPVFILIGTVLVLVCIFLLKKNIALLRFFFFNKNANIFYLLVETFIIFK